MAKTQSAWGIDVGRCALKAVKLRLTADGTVEVVAQEYLEHEKILSQPDADRHELIANALERFLSQNDVSKDRVIISVPGQHALARFTKLPPVAPKRIPDIVRYEADQQIPFDMDEVIWDYHTFQQEGMPDLEVGIFAMKRELIREHLLHFEQAAIEPVAIQTSPLCVYNAALYDDLVDEQTTILVDIGTENTDLVIATKDSLWTRTIPLGGNNFTEALVKSFKLSFAKAENLKRSASASKYARQVFQAMRPIFADLVQELQRSIGFYSSTHREARIEKVICVGNAFKLPGLQKYLQQNLNLDVTNPEKFGAPLAADFVANERAKDQLLSLFVAYGLALQGLDVTTISSNLLPAEMAKQAIWRKKRPAFAAAAVCLLLAGGSVWFRQTADMRALVSNTPGPSINSVDEASRIIDNGAPAGLSTRAQAEAVLAAGNLMKRELSSLSGQGELEQAETEQLIQVQKNKTVIPRILQLIHDSLPQRAALVAQADSASEMREALSTQNKPRNQRNQVFIEEFEMHYEPSLNEWDWTSFVEMPEPINETDTELPGIRLKITCTTPNQGGPEYIRDMFMNRLLEQGRNPGDGFYVDRVILFDGRQIGTVAETRGTTSKTQQTGGLAHEDYDVVTDEPLNKDWRFRIWVGIVLENYVMPEDDDEESDDT